MILKQFRFNCVGVLPVISPALSIVPVAEKVITMLYLIKVQLKFVPV